MWSRFWSMYLHCSLLAVVSPCTSTVVNIVSSIRLCLCLLIMMCNVFWMISWHNTHSGSSLWFEPTNHVYLHNIQLSHSKFDILFPGIFIVTQQNLPLRVDYGWQTHFTGYCNVATECYINPLLFLLHKSPSIPQEQLPIMNLKHYCIALSENIWTIFWKNESLLEFLNQKQLSAFLFVSEDWRQTVMRKDHCRISTQMQLEVDYFNKLMFVNVNFFVQPKYCFSRHMKSRSICEFFFHCQSEKSHSSECLLNVCKLFSHKF